VRSWNCKQDVDVHFEVRSKTVQKLSLKQQVGNIFGPLVVTTLVLSYTIVVMNFLYYGGLYAFPQIFADMETATLPVTNLIMGALWEVPGYLFAIVCGTFMGRKPCMMSSIFLNGIALFIFGILGSVSQADRTYWEEVALMTSYYGIKMLNNFSYTVAYVYASEVYPTAVRAMGSAVCIASGRCGSMIAPLVYEKLSDIYNGSFKPFFYLSGGLCVANFIFLFFIPETFNKKLGNDEDDGFTELVQVAH